MRSTNKLSDAKIRSTRPQERAYKLADGGGMFLLVNPDGGRYWRMKYRFAGKEKLLAFGAYPTVSLSEARSQRDQARTQLATGTDPSQARKEAKREAVSSAANSFEVVAREWHTLRARGGWTPGYSLKVLQAFETLIFPVIGHRPINAIRPAELLAALRRIESRGTVDRAKRQRQKCGEVFRYAMVTGRAESNPAADLAGALQAHQPQHYAALTPAEVPTFLRTLRADKRLDRATHLGLRLLALTFVRPGELQRARWEEFDLPGAVWIIPAERMKRRREHVVPLSADALNALEELKALAGASEFLFPGRHSPRKPISSNTFRLAIHRLGFEVTAHGFRATASTALNELGYRPDVIEAQLAHIETNKVRKAYNRAQYLDERREMMAHWASHLAALEAGAKVIPFNQRKERHA